MRASQVALFALAAVVCACATEPPSHTWPTSKRKAASAGTNGDPCAPGQSHRFEDDPDGVCVIKTERHVLDLTVPRSTSGAKTQALHILDAPAAAPPPAPIACPADGDGMNTCGPDGNASCCERSTVPAGTADALTAVAHDFELGTYLVTAGRLRHFVNAVDGNVRGTAANLAGFDQTLAAQLPSTRDEVDEQLGPACQFRGDPRDFGAATWWTPDVEAAVAELMSDDNETAADIRDDAKQPRMDQKPANCVSYAFAAAYCAWDGGRLPTNNEWAYAAVGGSELRKFPWGAEPSDATKLVTDLNRTMNGGTGDPAFTFPDDFPFFDNGMNAYHIGPPGRKPAGRARFGHHDMGGDVLEWMADVTGPGAGIVRGGSWEGHPEENSVVFTGYPLTRTYGSVGFRCAYGEVNPTPGAPPPPQPPTLHVVFHSTSTANGDLLDSLTADEGAPVFAGSVPVYRLEDAPPNQDLQAGLFRCRDAAGNHYLSNLDNCEGNGALDGPLGTVERGPVAGSVQIFRCYSGPIPGVPGGLHLTTTTPAECDAKGWAVEGSQGFVFPN